MGRLLLGILPYATEHDEWIVDNEVCEDERNFSKWFSDCSQTWKEILKRSDHKLGGRDGLG